MTDYDFSADAFSQHPAPMRAAPGRASAPRRTPAFIQNDYPEFIDGDEDPELTQQLSAGDLASARMLEVTDYPGTFYGSSQSQEQQSQQQQQEASASQLQRQWARPGLQQADNVSERSVSPDKPLNMVCVGPSFQVGGVHQHTLGLARFLNPSRVRLTRCFVTSDRPEHLPEPGTFPVPVEYCSMADLPKRTAKYDVVLAWGEGYNGRLESSGPLRVFLAHGESLWTRRGLEGSDQAVDHVIAVSQRVRDRVCEGFPTTTILNGVDSARLGQTRPADDVRKQLGFSRDDFVIGSVGRFTREKQMNLLIDAVARLPHHFKLMLVGSGRREDELMRLANERIPGRHAFIAAHDYLGDYYRAMDAFSLVSAHEGFGLVIPEAMMCERPVIVTNVGCVPEVIRDRINGIVVEPTSESIAAAAQLLRAHPSWARGIAMEGQNFATRHLHAMRMAQQYENLICNLHARRHSNLHRESASFGVAR
jgi:glycosyltransferase involved in cell wall biosynthesis